MKRSSMRAAAVLVALSACSAGLDATGTSAAAIAPSGSAPASGCPLDAPGSPIHDDATYVALEASLAAISDQRDALAAQMIALLDGAEFRGQPLRDCDVRPLIAQAHQLLAQIRALPR